MGERAISLMLERDSQEMVRQEWVSRSITWIRLETGERRVLPEAV